MKLLNEKNKFFLYESIIFNLIYFHFIKNQLKRKKKHHLKASLNILYYEASILFSNAIPIIFMLLFEIFFVDINDRLLDS